MAGSGRLGDPANAVTQRALRWCGYTSRPACGWIERDGIGVAFRRSPTGQDASGREGAFFVHALIWRAGQFPAGLLAGLWTADVWVMEPPEHPPERLPPLQTVEELGLGVPTPIDPDAARSALAAHLENLATGRRSAIALPPDAALALAAEIACVLPVRFGLPGFSTFEDPPNELEYDMVASTERHRHFATIAPAVEPTSLWAAAAQLLLDGRDGDESAVRAVAAFAEPAADPAAFAASLGRWMALETSSNPDHRASAEGVALAASDPRLLRRTVGRFGFDEIARGVVRGHSIKEVFESAAAIDAIPGVLAALVAALGRHAPGEAVAGLARMRSALGEADVVARVAGDLGEALLRAGTLAELDATQMHVLVSLQVQQPRTSVVDAVLQSGAATALVVEDQSLPAEWRGRAAAANPELAAEGELVGLLGGSLEAARAFSAHVTETGLAILGSALEATTTERGLQVLELVGHGLTEATRGALALPVLERLRPPTHLPAVLHYAPSGTSDARWGNAILDAYAEAVLDVRYSYAELPRILASILPYEQTPRFARWRDVITRLDAASGSEMRNSEFAWAARAAASLPAASDRDAAFELIVDRSAEAFPDDGLAWMTAMTLVTHEAGEPAPTFSTRLGRAALRSGRYTRRQIAYWTILWVANQLDAGNMSIKQLRDSPVSGVWCRLHAIDVEALAADGKVRGRSGAAQRWLRQNRDALAKHFAPH